MGAKRSSSEMNEVASVATASEWRQSRLGHDGEEQDVYEEVNDDFRGWRSRRELGNEDGEDEKDVNLAVILNDVVDVLAQWSG